MMTTSAYKWLVCLALGSNQREICPIQHEELALTIWDGTEIWSKVVYNSRSSVSYN